MCFAQAELSEPLVLLLAAATFIFRCFHRNLVRMFECGRALLHGQRFSEPTYHDVHYVIVCTYMVINESAINGLATLSVAVHVTSHCLEISVALSREDGRAGDERAVAEEVERPRLRWPHPIAPERVELRIEKLHFQMIVSDVCAIDRPDTRASSIR